MSYNIKPQIQSWLAQTKYDTLADVIIADDQTQLAADYIASALAVRYDTTTWTNESNTPGMILRMIAMLSASYALRKVISEDEGEHSYPDWLEKRVELLVLGLTDGSLDLPDVDPDPDAPGTGGLQFFPTDAATRLWEEEGNVEGAAARYFSSQQVF